LLIEQDPLTLEIADEGGTMPLDLAFNDGSELGLVQAIIPEYPLAFIARSNAGRLLDELKALVKGHAAALKVVDDTPFWYKATPRRETIGNTWWW
jgi:hypothetical protein